MTKKLENKIKIPSKNTVIGLAFLTVGLSSSVLSVDKGISTYNHLNQGQNKNYLQDYNPDYNVAIADGVICLTAGTFSLASYSMGKRNLSKK